MEVTVPGSDLWPAMRRLDALLQRATTVAHDVYGSSAGADRFRGLYVSSEEIGRLFTCEPGAPTLYARDENVANESSDLLSDASRLGWLAQMFNLSRFDLDVILIAIAPELDLRYERFYAFLQDDVMRKRPSADLILNLLCSSPEEKVAYRDHFGLAGPLVRHRLLHLIPDMNQVQPSLLAHYVKVDAQIVNFILGQESLDSRLVWFCQLISPSLQIAELPINQESEFGMKSLVRRAAETRESLNLYFYGQDGKGKGLTAEVLAAEIEAPLLKVDLARALAQTDFAQTLSLAFREAALRDAVLFVDGLDELRGDNRALQHRQLIDAICEHHGGIVILAGESPWVSSSHLPTGMINVVFPIPDFAERRRCWEFSLSEAGVTLLPEDLDSLSSRFRLVPEQIAEAVIAARSNARWRAACSPDEVREAFEVTCNDLFLGARTQSGRDLAALTQKVEPLYTWADIVLPDDSLTQLREMCERVTHRWQVFGQWGFGRKLSLGKGVNALFAGPSGTGKTMAAEIIANELSLDLYKIDLARVVSKYIGETEKNLDRIFTAAANANAILFFDEADALFGKRSEVRDSHDRYANIEISYLLQKIEQYEGIAILATNLRQNLDDAFVRRLAFTIHFPFPDDLERREIWTRVWPSTVPVASDVDMELLAKQFKLSGGNIRNIALSSAFLAAADGKVVTMRHVYQATVREHQKLGKTLSTINVH